MWRENGGKIPTLLSKPIWRPEKGVPPARRPIQLSAHTKIDQLYFGLFGEEHILAFNNKNLKFSIVSVFPSFFLLRSHLKF